MNCPYCDCEMEKGRIMDSAYGSIPVAFLEWISEEECAKKGFLASIKRKTIEIKDTDDGFYHNAFYCSHCSKVFGEFPT